MDDLGAVQNSMNLVGRRSIPICMTHKQLFRATLFPFNTISRSTR